MRGLFQRVNLAAFIGLVGFSGIRPTMTADAPATLKEVRDSFTLRGQPLPPEIFRDFGDGDLADAKEIWTSVDLLAAVGSNQYADPIVFRNGWVEQSSKSGGATETTAYRYVGPTTNGLLVAIAAYNGGGSGDFYTLHVMTLTPAQAFDADGRPYARLVLTNIRSVILGDGWAGSASISGNSVVIAGASASAAGPSKRLKIELVPPASSE